MADNKLLQQMLEHLVNDDQAKAEELFHEYVVTASREIYESLIDSEIAEEEKKDDDEGDDEENKKVDEEFEEFAQEGEDDMGDTPDMGDDLEGDLEMGDEEGPEEEKSEEELFMDLDSIVDELQAKFDELKGGGDMGGDDMGGDDMGDMGDEKMKDSMDLATVREYVEKVPGGHGAEKKGASEGALVGTGNKGQGSNTNAQGMKFTKNDMGGTTANILSGRNGADAGEVGAPGGQLKGNGLLKGKATEDNAGNINVPGGKAGSAFSTKEPGHGAEKAGAKESPDNKQSIFRGRR
jgi:hypothetical protein